MEGGITDALLQAGPLGAVLAAAILYIWYLHRELKRSQDARVEDAKKVTEKVLSLNDRWQESIGALTAAVEKLHTLIEARRTRR